MDLVALYFHLVLYFVVLFLNTFWWFNLSNIVQFAILVMLNAMIGSRVQQFKAS